MAHSDVLARGAPALHLPPDPVGEPEPVPPAPSRPDPDEDDQPVPPDAEEPEVDLPSREGPGPKIRAGRRRDEAVPG